MRITAENIFRGLLGVSALGALTLLAGAGGFIDFSVHNFQFPNNPMNPAIGTICKDCMIVGGVTTGVSFTAAFILTAHHHLSYNA